MLRFTHVHDALVHAHDIITSGLIGIPSGLAAVPCQSYSWEDCGSTVRISVSLPSSIPATEATAYISCEFCNRSLQLSIGNASGYSPSVLRIRTLYACVAPEECSWRLDNGGHFPKAVDVNGHNVVEGALILAGTKRWEVCITLRKADPALYWPHLHGANILQQKCACCVSEYFPM